MVKLLRLQLTLWLPLLSNEVFAADSYRWLHVTIETPWAIFLFLLPMVLIPVVLMAILYWRYAGKPSQTSTVGTVQEPTEKNKK